MWVFGVRGRDYLEICHIKIAGGKKKKTEIADSFDSLYLLTINVCLIGREKKMLRQFERVHVYELVNRICWWKRKLLKYATVVEGCLLQSSEIIVNLMF